MKWKLRPLKLEELSKASALIAESYLEDPFVQYFFAAQSAELKKKNVQNYFEAYLRSDFKNLVSLAAEVDGCLVGAGFYYPPGYYPPSVTNQFKAYLKTFLGFSKGLGFRKSLELLELDRELYRFCPTEPFIKAEVGCVQKAYQGSGLGSAMATLPILEADRLGIPTLAETSNPENLSLWKPMGYKVIHEIRIKELSYFVMLRKAQPPQ